MESVSARSLLAADEERIIGTLRASVDVDENKERCVETVRKEWDDILLRYNAALCGEEVSQAAADGMISVARRCAELLSAGKVTTVKGKGKVRTAAPCLLAAAAIAAAVAVFLFSEQKPGNRHVSAYRSFVYARIIILRKQHL